MNKKQDTLRSDLETLMSEFAKLFRIYDALEWITKAAKKMGIND